jgi:hypothetical protein
VAAHPELPLEGLLSLKGGGSIRCHQVLIISLPLTIGRVRYERDPGGSARSPSITEARPPSALLPYLRRPRSMKSQHPGTQANLPVGRPAAVSPSIPYRGVHHFASGLSRESRESKGDGRSVRVRINDCGPFARDRSLDLRYVLRRKSGLVAKEWPA